MDVKDFFRGGQSSKFFLEFCDELEKAAERSEYVLKVDAAKLKKDRPFIDAFKNFVREFYEAQDRTGGQ